MILFFFSTYKWPCWDFPGVPVLRTSLSTAGGVGSIPGQGAKIPNALQPEKKKKKPEAMLKQIQ